jgi:hypothetical protein
MIFYVYKDLSATITSGSWSDNIIKTNGIARQIYIESDSAGTVYDFKMIDSDNLVMLERTGITNILNELIEMPLKGVYTLQILNSTVDEDFKIKIVICER